MKKQVLVSLLIILFASCNSTTPQKSAEKFLNGFINNDSSAMLSCATDNTKELVRFYFMIRLDSIQFDKKNFHHQVSSSTNKFEKNGFDEVSFDEVSFDEKTFNKPPLNCL